MTKRKSFKRNAIASSNNYQRSKKAHREFLLDNHNNNAEYFKELKETVVVTTHTKVTIKKVVTVKVFGKTMILTADEIANRNIDSTLIID